jgi:hypothetical protein
MTRVARWQYGGASGRPGRHVGDCAFDQIKAVSAQPAARSRQLEGLRAGSVSSLRSLPDHIIKNTVFLALFGAHDVIPLRILLDPLNRPPGVQDQDVVDPVLRQYLIAGPAG